MRRVTLSRVILPPVVLLWVAWAGQILLRVLGGAEISVLDPARPGAVVHADSERNQPRADDDPEDQIVHSAGLLGLTPA